MLALGEEYTKRYSKKHLTITKCKIPLMFIPKGIPDGFFTEPPQCMPEAYEVVGCSITAYWNYYEQEKYLIAGKNEELITRDKLYESNSIIHTGNSNNIPC